ncbi:MAG: hypothetical protein BEU04_02165 [Marine Group III euryarchaeote CG-Bathy1]|uniref:Isopentenyl phosphate kinase n=1 Tax=Marine Group III euryarchaeote CG-Bathy1 TaxID=1889001 RepID=A0A1J5TG48_9ARCH|nr:MAG: hypothetical protein BEU04_02165 [Marine Group III euryarchaeote CG-Bathy1]
MKNNLVLVKWGGSLITVKDSPDPTPRMSVITDLAKKLSSLRMKTILIHGAGSFGHPLASEHSLADGQTRSRRQMEAVSETIDRIKQLNKIVCNRLSLAGLEPKPILPSKTMITMNDNLIDWPEEGFQSLLDENKLPVSCGDVVGDSTKGFSILSGDTLMVEFARYFKPAKTIFVVNHPGVMDRDPEEEGAELVPLIDRKMRKKMLRRKWRLFGRDVTGGMKFKLESAAEISKYSECWILGQSGFPSSLDEKIIGTRITND